MNRLYTFCIVFFFFLSASDIHAKRDFIFTYPHLRYWIFMEPFEAQLADSLKLYYNLDEGQIKAYGHALGDMHNYDWPDTIARYSTVETIAFIHEREKAFLDEVPKILNAEQFVRWKQDWDSSYDKTIGLMVYSCYARQRRVIYDTFGDWRERQTGIYWAEGRYSQLIENILGVDSTAARRLFNEQHVKREYMNKRDNRLWGVSDDQAMALGMCDYLHEYRLYKIELKEISGYLKDILRQKEDEIYWQSIIDALGYDFYCAWSDYLEIGHIRYDVSANQLDEFIKIQKQLEVDRVTINRGMPDISDQQRQRLLDAAGKRRDAAMEQLRNRK